VLITANNLKLVPRPKLCEWAVTTGTAVKGLGRSVSILHTRVPTVTGPVHQSAHCSIMVPCVFTRPCVSDCVRACHTCQSYYIIVSHFIISLSVAQAAAAQCRLLKLDSASRLKNWHQWHLRLSACRGNGPRQCRMLLHQSALEAQRQQQFPLSVESSLDAHDPCVSLVALMLVPLLYAHTQVFY